MDLLDGGDIVVVVFHFGFGAFYFLYSSHVGLGELSEQGWISGKGRVGFLNAYMETLGELSEQGSMLTIITQSRLTWRLWVNAEYKISNEIFLHNHRIGEIASCEIINVNLLV